MNEPKKSPAQRRVAIREVEAYLQDAQDACEKLDPRDRRRMQVAGVDLHTALCELRHVCHKTKSGVYRPRLPKRTPDLMGVVDQVFHNLDEVPDVAVRAQILNEFAECGWKQGIRLYDEVLAPRRIP